MRVLPPLSNLRHDLVHPTRTRSKRGLHKAIRHSLRSLPSNYTTFITIRRRRTLSINMKIYLAPVAVLAISLLPTLSSARPASHVRAQGGYTNLANTDQGHSPFNPRANILGQNFPSNLPQRQTATVERRGNQEKDAENVVEIDQDDRDFVVIYPGRADSALNGPAVQGPSSKEKTPSSKSTDGKTKGGKAKRQTQYGVVNNIGNNPRGERQAQQQQGLPVTPPIVPPAPPAARRSLGRRQSQVGIINSAPGVAPNANASPSAGGPPAVPLPAAVPPRRRSEAGRKDNDAQDLQTLTQAHFLTTLLTSSYTDGLAKFSLNDFKNASYPDWVRGRFEQMKGNSKLHDNFLGTALQLGKKTTTKEKEIVTPVKGCEFAFEYADVNSFVDQSLILETVVGSGLNGLIGFMDNKAYTAILASIMGVRGRHAAWISSSVRKSTPWNSAFESPLSINQAYTLVHKYAKSCPSSYDPRPNLKAFPSLEVKFFISGSTTTKAISSDDKSQPGHQGIVTFDLPKAYEGKRLFAALVRGTGTVTVPLSSRAESNLGTAEKKDARKVEMNIEFPKGMGGVVYVLVVSDQAMPVKEDKIVAGPGMVWFDFDSKWVG